MKIEGRCRNCGRDFPVDLVVSTAGRCPFCGKPLDADYGGLLVSALDSLQRVGTQMEAILERAKAVGENLDLEADTVLEPLRKALGEREEESAKRRATRQGSLAEEPSGAH